MRLFEVLAVRCWGHSHGGHTNDTKGTGGFVLSMSYVVFLAKVSPLSRETLMVIVMTITTRRRADPGAGGRV
ncbi:hypothetical protein ACIRQY_07015 [Streptomyces sp. NPDC101490]|uniref:hypothetical protein n=1 Tax=Streptomyces sp. NPDC101490 TaxID=3366143 RepID=UPI003801825A